MQKSGSENAARCAAFAGMIGCALSFYYRGARAFLGFTKVKVDA